jgi:hypothetical protein
MRISTEVSAEDFLTAYFRLQGIFKCCFTIYPYHVGLQEFYQAIRDADMDELYRKLLQRCWGLFGPSTSGQYSLRHKCNRLLAGRIDINFHPANQHEAEEDFQMLGDQVMGEELTGDPKEKGHAVLNFLGSQFMYQGPMRFEKLVCPLISYEGGLPTADQVAKLVEELDQEAVNEMILPGCQKVLTCYFFLHAAKGEILIAPFKEIEEYNPEQAIILGKMEMRGDDLIFFPMGDRSAPADFSVHLFQEQ